MHAENEPAQKACHCTATASAGGAREAGTGAVGTTVLLAVRAACLLSRLLSHQQHMITAVSQALPMADSRGRARAAAAVLPKSLDLLAATVCPLALRL